MFCSLWYLVQQNYSTDVVVDRLCIFKKLNLAQISIKWLTF